GAGDWERLRALGEGNLAQVFLARHTGSGELAALKVMDKAKLAKARRTERAQVELAVLRAVSHPFVLSLVSAFQDERWAYIVTELAPGGDLFGLLQRQPYCRLSEPAARFYCAELVVAIEWLHLHGVIIRDLKPENILIAASGHVRAVVF
ncbi:kinase-like domain-containing protein, partial [Pavlovales sp. CCMP2436]